VAPLFTNEYSLLDLLGLGTTAEDGTMYLSIIPFWPIHGPKDEVEMMLRAGATVLGVTLLLVSGYIDAYRPARTLENFRSDYLDQVGEEDWRKSKRIPKEVRINVMYLRFRFRFPLCSRFELVWKDGFEPSDRDVKMWLFKWQGVCGLAARRREAVFDDLRSNPIVVDTFAKKYLLWNRYTLTYWQLKRTEKLKAILSIPIYERRGARGREVEHCVGVINLDTKTDRGADYLAENTKNLAIFFAKHGTLIAKMRG
jgi:hypothetical protein